MSDLSKVLDPLKPSLSAEAQPALEALIAEIQAATQRFTSKLPTGPVGQMETLAINTLLGLASFVGPSLLQAELGKYSTPLAQPGA